VSSPYQSGTPTGTLYLVSGTSGYAPLQGGVQIKGNNGVNINSDSGVPAQNGATNIGTFGTGTVTIGNSTSGQLTVKGTSIGTTTSAMATSSLAGFVPAIDTTLSSSSTNVPTTSSVYNSIVNGSSFGTGATSQINIGNASTSPIKINGLSTPLTSSLILGGCISNETTQIIAGQSISIPVPQNMSITASSIYFMFTKTPVFASGSLTFDITPLGSSSSIFSTKPSFTSSASLSNPGVLNTSPTVFNAGGGISMITLSILTAPTMNAGTGIGLKFLIYAA